MNKQETLEEAAEKYNDDFQIKSGSKAPHIKNVHIMNHFIEGAKWQQERMYSEEEMIDLIQFLSMNEEFNGYGSVSKETAQYFLEQFKKK
jgi:hypothetical protein